MKEARGSQTMVSCIALKCRIVDADRGTSSYSALRPVAGAGADVAEVPGIFFYCPVLPREDVVV